MSKSPSFRSWLWDLTVVVGGFVGLAVVLAVMIGTLADTHSPPWILLSAFGLAVLGVLYLIMRPDLRRFKQWRLRQAHRCPACGYDRRGLTDDATCPECGRGA